MSDVLAIFGPDDTDSELITELERLHPTRVTVVLDTGPGRGFAKDARPGTGGVDCDWAADDGPTAAALRERMAALLTLIERRTGATVTGVAGGRDQLVGWRFDREVSVRVRLAA